MKRPLAVVGFTLLGALVVLCAFNSIPFALIAAGVSYVLFITTGILDKTRERHTLPTVFFTVIIACIMFYSVQSDYEKLSSLADTDTTVLCRVEEKTVFNKDYGRYYCKAKVLQIDGEKYKGNIRLSFNTTYDNIDPGCFEIGNKLYFKGHLYTVGGENKGIVDYFKSENIYIGVYGIKELSVLRPERRPIAYYGDMLREFIAEGFRDNFSTETAGFLTALLTGSKEYISDRVYDTFKRSGIAHIMAVSGMHLAVLAMFVGLFAKKLKDKHKVIYFIIMCLFVLIVMFTAAFSSSVVRAGIMLFMVLIGNILGEHADSLNSLGFACICILLFNPFSAMNVGFLLSAVSTWAIIVFAVPFCNKHRYFVADRLGCSGAVSYPVAKAVMFSLTVSICVMVCTFPITALSFGEVSLISPVTNLFFLPVTTLIICLSFVSAILCSLGIMPGWLVFIIEKISGYCIYVAELFGGDGRFMLKVDTTAKEIICCLVPLVWYFAIKMTKYLYRKIKKKRTKPLL